ncbi:MAG: hypothetical protein GDA36_01685 [Rhodobacteraceae bacterium]|nr:hypothetical protein [Paracoccaceae bacterium]
MAGNNPVGQGPSSGQDQILSKLDKLDKKIDSGLNKIKLELKEIRTRSEQYITSKELLWGSLVVLVGILGMLITLIVYLESRFKDFKVDLKEQLEIAFETQNSTIENRIADSTAAVKENRVLLTKLEEQQSTFNTDISTSIAQIETGFAAQNSRIDKWIASTTGAVPSGSDGSIIPDYPSIIPDYPPIWLIDPPAPAVDPSQGVDGGWPQINGLDIPYPE